MKKKDRVKVGDRIESNSCGTFTILERVGDRNLIKFDTGFITTINNHCVNNGKVKDPLFTNVFGVGYLGVGEYVTRSGGYKSLPEYNAWINMLQRCYYDKYSSRVDGVKTYDDVQVVEEWYNFQNFAGWYVPRRKRFETYNFGSPCLDKDILAVIAKSKVYGPNTCCLVPTEINGAFIGINNEEGGIAKSRSGYYIKQKGQIVANGIETIEEAVSIRKEIKHKQLVGLAIKYQEVLEPIVYDKLCNWFEVDLKNLLVISELNSPSLT